MNATETLKCLIESMANVSQRTLAKSLGVTQPAIQHRLNSNNPSLDTLISISSELGYDVYVMPSDERKPKGAILIEENNEA